MPPRSEEILRKQKEARQKKVLFALAPVLLLLLIIQGPRLLKAVGGSEQPVEAAAPFESSEPPAGTPEASLDPGLAAAPSTAGSPTAVGSGAAASGVLPDTNVPPTADEGQLLSFDRFVSKDPFKQQITDSGSGTGASGADSGKPGQGGGKQEPALPVAARLRINGTLASVPLGESFPQDEDVFELTAIADDGSSVEISLVNGNFSNGSSSFTLALGEQIALVSQPDGFRYTIKLLSVS